MIQNGDQPVVTPPSGPSELSQQDTVHWRELAARRLALLVTAEHDISTLRDRLDMLQSEQQWLLRERGEQLLRIRNLESELATVVTSRSWRLTAPLRRSSYRWLHVKATLRSVLRWLVKRPAARPVIRLIASMFPGLSLRWRARLHAQ